MFEGSDKSAPEVRGTCQKVGIRGIDGGEEGGCNCLECRCARASAANTSCLLEGNPARRGSAVSSIKPSDLDGVSVIALQKRQFDARADAVLVLTASCNSSSY